MSDSVQGAVPAVSSNRPGLIDEPGQAADAMQLKVFQPSQIWGPKRKQFVPPEGPVRSREFRPKGLDVLTRREEPEPVSDKDLSTQSDASDSPEEMVGEAEVAEAEPIVPEEPPAPVEPPPPPEPDPQLIEAAFQEGFQAGEQAAQDAHAQRRSELDALIEQLQMSQRQLALDPLEQFMPLKRLALHIAEEVVRGELQTPALMIEQLVQAALEEVNAGGGLPVRIHLNPEDARMYREHLREPRQDVDWVEDPMVSRGSLKLRTDATAIDDLIDQRLSDMAEALLGQHAQWQPRSLGAPTTAPSPPESIASEVAPVVSPVTDAPSDASVPKPESI